MGVKGEGRAAITQESVSRSTLKAGDKFEELAKAMANPDDFTREEVVKLRKACIKVREDIVQLVKDTAMKEKFKVIGSPFETDHQLKALMNQGCIDAVWSTDSDYSTLGIKRVIFKLKKEGSIQYMDYDKLVGTVLPKKFGIDRAVTREELALWAVMSGTDYIPMGMPGEGKVAVDKRMTEYVGLSAIIADDGTLHISTPSVANTSETPAQGSTLVLPADALVTLADLGFESLRAGRGHRRSSDRGSLRSNRNSAAGPEDRGNRASEMERAANSGPERLLGGLRAVSTGREMCSSPWVSCVGRSAGRRIFELFRFF